MTIDISRRFDPLRGYKFLVKGDGVDPGVSRISGINENIDDAGNRVFDNIVIERGLSLYSQNWEWWAQVVEACRNKKERNVEFKTPVRMTDYHLEKLKKDLTIVLFDRDCRKPIMGWKITGAIPVRIEHGILDASSCDVMIEKIEIKCDDIKRVFGKEENSLDFLVTQSDLDLLEL